MSEDAPKLLIDGSCGFCQSAAGWCANATSVEVLDGTAMEEQALAGLGISAADVARELVLVEADGRTSGGAAAVARLLELRGGAWRWLGVAIGRRPLSWLAAPAYRAVARVRHRLPGARA